MAPSHPASAKSVTELRELSDDELIAQHDQLAPNAGVGVGYYLEELARRRLERQTKTLVLLTAAITLLTVVNVVAVIVSL
jgi:transcription termination factor Rho